MFLLPIDFILTKENTELFRNLMSICSNIKISKLIRNFN